MRHWLGLVELMPASLRSPGLRADFTLYSDSILESGELMPQVLQTYLDGDMVWSSDKLV